MLSGSQLRVKYDRLKTRLAEAKAKTAKAKSQYEHAKAHEAGVEADFNEVRAALDAALDAMAGDGGKKASVPSPPSKATPVHVPPYLRELVAAFPASGTATLEDLRAALSLPDSTVNTRIQKAKKLGLVVRSGRAEYSLTDLGKSSRGGRLQAAHDAGAVAYIPFKAGTVGGKDDLWSKMFHYFQFKREDFLAHYHERSNVETVFSMVQAKFGKHVKSKNPTAQVNELYCKFIGHNICVLISSVYELGIAPEFWSQTA